MATSSIFANVVVESEEAARKISDAYDACEKSTEKPSCSDSLSDSAKKLISLVKEQFGKKD